MKIEAEKAYFAIGTNRSTTELSTYTTASGINFFKHGAQNRPPTSTFVVEQREQKMPAHAVHRLRAACACVRERIICSSEQREGACQRTKSLQISGAKHT